MKDTLVQTPSEKKLEAFLQHTIKQFLECAVSSGIIKPEEKERAEKHLANVITELAIEPRRSGVEGAARRCGRHNEKIRIILSEKYKELIEQATSFDSECLERNRDTGDYYALSPAKQVLFHELFHVLQFDTSKLLQGGETEYCNRTKVIDGVAAEKHTSRFGVGSAMNEIAASYADKILWGEYLRNIRGYDDVKEATSFSGNFDGKTFFKPVVMRESDNIDPSKILSYRGEVSIGERMVHTLGIQRTDIARASTIFGEDNRKEIKTKYEQTTGRSYTDLLEALDYANRLTKYDPIKMSPDLQQQYFHDFCAAFGLTMYGLENPITGSKDDGKKFTRMALSSDPIYPNLQMCPKVVLPNDEKLPPQKLILSDDDKGR